MKKLFSFFVVLALALLMPLSFISAQVDDLPEIGPIKIITLGEVPRLNKTMGTMAVIISQFTGPDTLDLNQRGQWYIIWTPSLAGTYKLLASYSDGTKDSVITNATANTGYGTYLYHKFSISGDQNVTISITGQESTSSTRPVYIRPLLNNVPIVNNVAIVGSLIVGQTLTCNYSYSDIENDLQGQSIIKWYRNGLIVSSSGSVSYVLTLADVGAMFEVGVIPVAQTGASPGIEVKSSTVGPVVNPNLAPIIEFVGYTGVINHPSAQQIDLRVKDDGTNLDISVKIYSLPSNELKNNQTKNINITPNTSTHVNWDPVFLPVGNYKCEIKVSDSYLDTQTSFTFKVEAVTGVDNEVIPIEFNLFQNYPNPFNPTTSIQYSLPEASPVKIVIYDISGREVETLVNEYKNSGVHNIKFDGGNLSTGVYIYRIVAGKFVETKKMTLIK